MTALHSTSNAAPPRSPDLATLAAAQADMRAGYVGGAAGMAASSLVWAVASCIAAWSSPQRAVWALFIGGMFIHPAGMLLARALGRSGSHARNNPLAGLAAATTLWMIMMLVLVYLVSLLRMDWFFPAMLLVIGGRYLCFQALYGDRTYLACGAVLALAALGLAALRAPPALAGFTGAAVECGFACVILLRERKPGASAAISA